jgi:hypothetical protein
VTEHRGQRQQDIKMLELTRLSLSLSAVVRGWSLCIVAFSIPISILNLMAVQVSVRDPRPEVFGTMFTSMAPAPRDRILLDEALTRAPVVTVGAQDLAFPPMRVEHSLFCLLLLMQEICSARHSAVMSLQFSRSFHHLLQPTP